MQEKIMEKSLKRIKQELYYAANGKSDIYIKLKIEKAISILEVLIDIIENK